MKRILSYYKFYKFKLVLVIIVKIIWTALDLVIPFLLSFILDKILPNIDVNNYLNIIFLLIYNHLYLLLKESLN